MPSEISDSPGVNGEFRKILRVGIIGLGEIAQVCLLSQKDMLDSYAVSITG